MYHDAVGLVSGAMAGVREVEELLTTMRESLRAGAVTLKARH